MHQIRVALGLETEEKREALRKRQRERRAANRHVDSSATARNIKRSARICPNSQLPSVSI